MHPTNQIRLFYLIKICFLISLILIFSCNFSSPTTSSSCADLQIIFARGSGEPSNTSRDYLAFKSALTNTLSSSKLPLSYTFYDLGTQKIDNYQYPAVSITDFKVSTTAYLSAGQAFAFGDSVKQGIGELKSFFTKTLHLCPKTKFILAGYSQGAMVISQTLPSLPADKIIYVANFGDPKLYLPEGLGPLPPACRGLNFSNYRISVPDCQVNSGILQALVPYQSPSFTDKLGVWCNNADFICGSYFDFKNFTYGENLITGLLKTHLAYSSNGSYQHASQIILQKIKSHFTFQSPLITTSSIDIPRDTVILLDSTKSMSPFIANYQAEALRLAEQTLRHNGRIALFEYRDLRDDPSYSFALRKRCDFSCNFIEFNHQLHQIITDDGGDAPESALSAAYHAMGQLNWRPQAVKSLILLTDATFHQPDLDGTTLEQVVKRSLEIDPINFFIITDKSHLQLYQKLANLTGGKVLSSNSNLAKLTDYLLHRPLANLKANSYFAQVGQEITFDASNSFGSTPLRFEWDLDLDGNFEVKTSQPLLRHTYFSPLSGHLQVKAIDHFGQSSTMSATLQVIDQPLHPAQILNSSLISIDTTQLQLNFSSSPQTKLTLVTLDQAPLTLTALSQINIEHLDLNLPHSITLTPIDSFGRPGSTHLLNFIPTTFYHQKPSPSFTPTISHNQESSLSTPSLNPLSEINPFASFLKPNKLNAPNTGLQ